MENEQRGLYFLSLHNGKKVNRYTWTELATPNEVIWSGTQARQYYWQILGHNIHYTKDNTLKDQIFSDDDNHDDDNHDDQITNYDDNHDPTMANAEDNMENILYENVDEIQTMKYGHAEDETSNKSYDENNLTTTENNMGISDDIAEHKIEADNQTEEHNHNRGHQHNYRNEHIPTSNTTAATTGRRQWGHTSISVQPKKASNKMHRKNVHDIDSTSHSSGGHNWKLMSMLY